MVEIMILYLTSHVNPGNLLGDMFINMRQCCGHGNNKKKNCYKMINFSLRELKFSGKKYFSYTARLALARLRNYILLIIKVLSSKFFIKLIKLFLKNSIFMKLCRNTQVYKVYLTNYKNWLTLKV